MRLSVFLYCLLFWTTLACAETRPIADFVPAELLENLHKSALTGKHLIIGADSQYLRDYASEKLDIKELVSLGAENYYKRYYKEKKERLMDQPVYHEYNDRDTNDRIFFTKYDVETYYMVYSFACWINFIEKAYRLPQLPPTRYADAVNLQKQSFFDGFCYRFINSKDKVCHDIVIMTGVDADFDFKKSEYAPFSEMYLLESYDVNESKFNLKQIFRYASSVTPIVKENATTKDIYISRYKFSRTIGGNSLWAFLHDYYAHRVKDSYVLVITSSRFKIIIQSYFSHDVDLDIVENDQASILKSLVLQ